MFDALHLGHLYLLQEVKKRLLRRSHIHKSPLLDPPRKTPHSPPLSRGKTAAPKEKAGVDLLIALPFTQELASLSYADFLQKVRAHLPFTTLVLGKGATFGKKREGTEEKIRELAPSMGSTPLYLEKKTIDGTPISTSAIRALIAEGKITGSRASARPSQLKGIIMSKDLWNRGAAQCRQVHSF